MIVTVSLRAVQEEPCAIENDRLRILDLHISMHTVLKFLVHMCFFYTFVIVRCAAQLFFIYAFEI